MAVPSPTTLEALNAAGDGLRVTFFWRVDRYAHRIELLDAGLAIPLLESVEGSDLDRWPPSPPLQQLTLGELPDGRPVALLVGMAGASHWSLSVEAEPGAAALLFDAACRVTEPGAQLGSAYRSVVRHEVHGAAAALHRPGGRGQPAIVGPIAASPPGDAGTQIQVDGRGVQIGPPGDLAAEQTVRWKYRIAAPA